MCSADREEFLARKVRWLKDIQPTTAEGEFALDRVVAATIRIDQCGQAMSAAIADHKSRADLSWDSDRAAEVAAVAKSLARRPEVVAAKLRTSRHGVELLLAMWNRLLEPLQAEQGAWSEEEVSTALDLLGIHRHLRSGRLPFDTPQGMNVDLLAYRGAFVLVQIRELQDLRDKAFAAIDAMERDSAQRGTSALLSKPVALILRYEREAYRRYETMLAAAKADSNGQPVPAKVAEEARACEEVEEPVQEVAEVEEPVEVVEPTPVQTIIAHPAEPARTRRRKARKLNREQRRALDAQARRR